MDARLAVLAVACLLNSCASSQADSTPSIEITRVPPAGGGDGNRLDPIEGLRYE